MLKGIYEVIGEKTKSGLFNHTGSTVADPERTPLDLFRKVRNIKRLLFESSNQNATSNNYFSWN
jgi:hypothetical protein